MDYKDDNAINKPNSQMSFRSRREGTKEMVEVCRLQMRTKEVVEVRRLQSRDNLPEKMIWL